MIITVNNIDNLPVDQKVLGAALMRCASLMTSDVETITIYIVERNPMEWPEHRNPGMLIYKMRLQTSQGKRYLEVVSRKPHLSVEFHG